MAFEAAIPLDVAVVGGGPAGISACLELAKSPDLRIALFESEPELGGMPRTCHFGFGMRDRKRFYTGPAYARKLNRLIRRTGIKISTQATVIHVAPGARGELHGIKVATRDGLKSYETRFMVLSTGCFENSRPARDIPGERPAGIYTTGTLQQMVNVDHVKPGKRALVVGSEHVSLSCVWTLWRAGTSIAGMVEEDPELHTYASAAKAASFFFRFPIYKGTSVEDILGRSRVEGVNLVDKGREKSFTVDCDTVVITGKFRPVSALIDNTAIERDPLTEGPVVDANLMTSVPNIFAAGNVLRGADMGDLCGLEGKRVGQNILKNLKESQPEGVEYISIRAESPIRYVVPQKIIPKALPKPLPSSFRPGFSIQTEHTLKNPTLEAWSGNERIWKGSFSKLLATNRTPLPVNKFDWNRVDPKQEIVLRIGGGHNESF